MKRCGNTKKNEEIKNARNVDNLNKIYSEETKKRNLNCGKFKPSYQHRYILHKSAPHFLKNTAIF